VRGASRLVKEHESSGKLLKPYLEGKDLRPWFVEKEDRWLVFTRQGTEIDNYPAIKRHLDGYRDHLTPRAQESGGPGRKPGTYQWFEIQDTVAYWEAFEQPKIMWPDISKLPRFYMDTEGHYVGNTGFVIPLCDYYLLGILASWATWFSISRTCQPLRLRGGRWQYRLFRQFMERLPIPTTIGAADREAIASLARQCNELGPQCYAIEQEVLRRIRDELLTDNQRSQRIEQWWGSISRHSDRR
jgi:hypothetical protein